MRRYIVACLPVGFVIFLKYSPRDKTELRTANFTSSLRQALPLSLFRKGIPKGKVIEIRF